MTTRSIRNELDRELAIRAIQRCKLPSTMTLIKGAKRSTEQNRLQRMWINEVSEQLGDQTPEEVRGYCKLTMGVPILRAENEAFRQSYDEMVKPLPYEQKMKFMMEPLDLPVTRMMTARQSVQYLDAIWKHFTEQGLILTDPDPEARRTAREAA